MINGAKQRHKTTFMGRNHTNGTKYNEGFILNAANRTQRTVKLNESEKPIEMPVQGCLLTVTSRHSFTLSVVYCGVRENKSQCHVQPSMKLSMRKLQCFGC